MGASRWSAVALLVLAVAAGIAGHLLLARLLVWLLVAILIWAAATLWLRTVAWRKGSVPYPQPLAPGESYDTAVKLTSVPNVPIAEAICTRLRANGIEAFYKRPQLAQFITDFGPAEIWVGEHQLEEARTLLGSQAV